MRPLRLMIAATLAAAWASAQAGFCPGQDGFSPAPYGVPMCCLQGSGGLPAFPSMVVPGLGATLHDCALEVQYDTLGALVPIQVSCDEWLIDLTVNAMPKRFLIVNQTLRAKYVRTWLELPGAGLPTIQVWRFLVNGDLACVRPPAGELSPSSGPVASDQADLATQVPLSALPPYQLPVHFVGHLDYARNCATGVWEIAYSLSHFCPAESHAGYSRRPIAAAAGWPKRTYHLVSPARFVFADGLEPAGNAWGESARTSLGYSDPLVPYTCLGRAGLGVFAGINLVTTATNCACSDATGTPPNRYKHQTLSDWSWCTSSLTSSANNVGAPVASVPTPLPGFPTGLRAYVIGAFTSGTGSSYPGTQCLSVYLAALDAPPLSPPACPVQQPSLHAATGIGITGGHLQQRFQATLTGTVQPGYFSTIDLQNMLMPGPAGVVPGFGSAFVSERVWSLQMGLPEPGGGGGGGGGG